MKHDWVELCEILDSNYGDTWRTDSSWNCSGEQQNLIVKYREATGLDVKSDSAVLNLILSRLRRAVSGNPEKTSGGGTSYYIIKKLSERNLLNVQKSLAGTEVPSDIAKTWNAEKQKNKKQKTQKTEEKTEDREPEPEPEELPDLEIYDFFNESMNVGHSSARFPVETVE
jgi:hypothetical protein